MGSLNGLSFFILYSHCYADFFNKCSQVLQRMFTKHRYNSLVEKGFMKKAQIIDVYTSAGNINFALNFQFQMQEIGIQVNVPVDEYQQRLIAASSNENHLAIIITFGGRGILSDILPRILHKVKTPIVLISSYDYTFKDFDADYQLYISPYENHYKKISSFSTRLSILYILDVLYTCYFKLDYQENIEKKLAYYNNIVEGTIK